MTGRMCCSACRKVMKTESNGGDRGRKKTGCWPMGNGREKEMVKEKQEKEESVGVRVTCMCRVTEREIARRVQRERER